MSSVPKSRPRRTPGTAMHGVAPTPAGQPPGGAHGLKPPGFGVPGGTRMVAASAGMRPQMIGVGGMVPGTSTAEPSATVDAAHGAGNAVEPPAVHGPAGGGGGNGGG